MVRYQIEYNKAECIGCGACVSQCPENWELKETDDGFKAKPKITNIGENEYDSNLEAADICPVDCIKLEKIKGKRAVPINEEFEEEM